jgi:hypothetical protein
MFGIDEVVKIGLNIIDKVIPDPNQKAAAQLALEQLAQQGELAKLQADMNEQQELTKRVQADMMSDSWLSKNIRPMTLIFILVTYTVFAMMSAWDIEVNTKYVELMGTWGMVIMSFYFGGRSLEKIVEMRNKK